MVFTLSAATILSLLIAITMGVVTYRLLREERRRSDARVAALAEELRRDAGAGRPAPDPEPPAAPEGGADLPLFDPAPESTSTLANRLAAFGAAVVIVVVVLAVGFYVLSRDGAERAPDDPHLPVELLALEHDTAGPLLAISGSVRNPADAAGVAELFVVAMAFDETGAMIASRQTRIAAPRLAPGTASPFVVEIPAEGISRYRISFAIDDATVPHVDLRPEIGLPAPIELEGADS